MSKDLHDSTELPYLTALSYFVKACANLAYIAYGSQYPMDKVQKMAEFAMIGACTILGEEAGISTFETLRRLDAITKDETKILDDFKKGAAGND